MLRKTIVRIALGAMLVVPGFAALSGPAAVADTRCQKVGVLGYLCVTTPADGIEVFRTSDPTHATVHGVGLECSEGLYFLQYQLGSQQTYRPVPLIPIGRSCPIFS